MSVSLHMYLWPHIHVTWRLTVNNKHNMMYTTVSTYMLHVDGRKCKLTLHHLGSIITHMESLRHYTIIRRNCSKWNHWACETRQLYEIGRWAIFTLPEKTGAQSRALTDLTDELTQVNRRGLSLELLNAEKRRHILGKDSMNGSYWCRYAKDEHKRELYQVLAGYVKKHGSTVMDTRTSLSVHYMVN